ncbi:MAG TPA: metalloregulator ArsR/SmtB family transcription factor [Tepidisphaeraceae bacterium]|jgi:DNA-binding transcriptional ArsR family regulator
MARMATTTDVFNAVAEPRRREIIDLLARKSGWSVTELVLNLGMPQPTVSKHLGVLREVGLVSVDQKGKQRLYSLQPRELKPMYDWVKYFEKFWDEHLQSIKVIAEQKARELSKKEKS